MTSGEETIVTISETGQAQLRLPRLSGSIPLVEGTSGEIRLTELHSDQERLADYLSRQQQDLEWIALKAWWSAGRALTRATDTGNAKRIEVAKRDRRKVIELYGPALRRARVKWRRARKEYEYRRRHPVMKSIETTGELPGASGL